jgi:predicted outer membrane repeat protein
LWLAAPAAGQSIRYVDDNASAGGDGLTWETAYRDLQDALAEAGTNGVISEIRVAEGTYRPDCMPHPCFGTIGDREAGFELLNGVAIMGGYRGCPGRDCTGDPDERDIDLYETILSGDLNNNDGPDFANNDENSYHVVTAIDLDETASLDGFTVTGGNADHTDWEWESGGGMFCYQGVYGPTVANCTFQANCASQCGGGLWATEYATPTLSACTFADNVADGWGGGAAFFYSGNVPLTGCVFENNRASDGGGVYNNDSGVELTDCLFKENTADDLGGALFGPHGWNLAVDCLFLQNSAGYGGAVCGLDGGNVYANCAFVGNVAGSGGAIGVTAWHISVTYAQNCVFTGNHATSNGGAAASAGALLPAFVALNCTMSGNTCEGQGGAVYAGHGGHADLYNSVLWGNADAGGSDESGQIDYYDEREVPLIDHCCIQGWTGALGGEGNIGDDPLFLDPTGPDGVLGTTDDNFRLGPGSPCIDAADNTHVHEDSADLDGDGDTDERTPFDFDYGPRFLDDPTTPDIGVADPPDYPSVVDIGAYEYASPVVTAVSMLDHGRTELGLDILANDVEPRVNGLLKIEVQTSTEVTDVSADVACVNSVYGGTVTATPSGTTVTLDFSPALPDVDCCQITMTGDVDECFTVRPLAGDTDRSGVVSTADVSVIKPHFGETADADNAEFDFDCDGLITMADFSQIKPLFGHSAPGCP